MGVEQAVRKHGLFVLECDTGAFIRGFVSVYAVSLVLPDDVGAVLRGALGWERFGGEPKGRRNREEHFFENGFQFFCVLGFSDVRDPVYSHFIPVDQSGFVAGVKVFDVAVEFGKCSEIVENLRLRGWGIVCAAGEQEEGEDPNGFERSSFHRFIRYDHSGWDRVSEDLAQSGGQGFDAGVVPQDDGGDLGAFSPDPNISVNGTFLPTQKLSEPLIVHPAVIGFPASLPFRWTCRRPGQTG